MRESANKPGWISLAAAVIALAVWESAAIAADGDDLVDDPAGKAVNKEAVIGLNPASTIHNWVFYGNQFGSREGPESKLESLLRTRIADLARAGALSDEQKQKLLLAGEGDIRRFIDRVEQMKSRYRSETFDQNGWMQLHEQTQPLHLEFLQGPFSQNSLFAKTLARTLTPEQAARVEREDRSRLSFQHRAGVRMTVWRLSTAMGLSEDQRRRLEQLLMAETHPTPILRDVFPPARYVVIYVQIAHIRAEKLKPLFNAWQWHTLQLKLAEIPRYAANLRENDIGR
jgi:hypothetical protein